MTAVAGVILVWHADEGWGVVDTAATPGGCWAHFSAGAVAGFVSFAPGDRVQVEWERADQDGYAYRATRLWPAGRDPVDRGVRAGGAYSSTLVLTFDPPDNADTASA